jgi:NAD(P)-dependent dehydrogenase (short-subunit alcohol dehydrogenase family)
VALFLDTSELDSVCPKNSCGTDFFGCINLIYRETVKALLAVGAPKVIVCGRNAQLQQSFVESLDESVRDRIDASHTINLGDLSSVRDFAKYVDQTYTTIDVLICNAGVMVRFIVLPSWSLWFGGSFS